jgi:hypothetical protein
MKVEIRDLELNKELDTKSKVATRGGLGALTVETTSAAATANLKAGCTAGTHSVCHIDGTDDADSGGIFGLLA